MNITINDYTNVMDSDIYGVVVAKKKDSVIFNRHNTIVNSGKKFIMNAAAEYFKNNQPTIVLGYGSSGNGTSKDFTIDDFKPVIDSSNKWVYFQKIIFKDNSSQQTSNALLNTTENRIEISVSFTSRDDIPADIGELGIVYTDNITKANELFSRIAFDPIPLISGDPLSIDYYIYF